MIKQRDTEQAMQIRSKETSKKERNKGKKGFMVIPNNLIRSAGHNGQSAAQKLVYVMQSTQYLAPTQSSLAKQRTADELPSPSKLPPPFSPSAVPGSPLGGPYEPVMQRSSSFAESLRYQSCALHGRYVSRCPSSMA